MLLLHSSRFDSFGKLLMDFIVLFRRNFNRVKTPDISRSYTYQLDSPWVLEQESQKQESLFLVWCLNSLEVASKKYNEIHKKFPEKIKPAIG